MKRGQMEVIGLVVIVILITIGMLFMATFALKSDPQKKIFTRKGLAYSTMSAVMKVTVSEAAECHTDKAEGLTPRLSGDIIEDCALYGGTDSSYKCKGPIYGEPLHSCAFFEEMVAHLLDQTLGSWNKNYEFHSQLIALRGERPIDIIEPITVGEGCPPYKERDSSGLFPINTEAGLVENSLYLCD